MQDQALDVIDEFVEADAAAAGPDELPPPPEKQGEDVERTVRENSGLVFLLARRYSRGSQQLLDELVAAGNEGLVIAAKRFDASRGTKFSTYAFPWIRACILRAVGSERLFFCSDHTASHYSRYTRIVDRLIAEGSGEKPDIDAIVREMQKDYIRDNPDSKTVITPDIVKRLQEWEKVRLPDSLDKEQHIQWQDKAAQDIEQQLIEAERKKIRSETVRCVLSKMPDRERKILCAHFGIGVPDGKKRVLQKIGIELDLSRQRVQQIEKQAKERFILILRSMVGVDKVAIEDIV